MGHGVLDLGLDEVIDRVGQDLVLDPLGQAGADQEEADPLHLIPSAPAHATEDSSRGRMTEYGKRIAEDGRLKVNTFSSF